MHAPPPRRPAPEQRWLDDLDTEEAPRLAGRLAPLCEDAPTQDDLLTWDGGEDADDPITDDDRAAEEVERARVVARLGADADRVIADPLWAHLDTLRARCDRLRRRGL